MFKKTLLTTAAIALMSSSVMAEELSIRQQAIQGSKAAIVVAVDATDDFTQPAQDLLVSSSKATGSAIATGAVAAKDGVVAGAVATKNGAAYTFNLTADAWSQVEDLESTIAVSILTPFVITADVLDLVWDGSKEVYKGGKVAGSFVKAKSMDMVESLDDKFGF